MAPLIGLIVNPLAGIGGRLGFKGSDGAYGIRALLEGAEPVSPLRARIFLDSLNVEARILVPPGIMGYDSLQGSSNAGMLEVVRCVSEKRWPTTAHDTRRCAITMVEEGASLIVFVGGDGTARDVMSAVDRRVPVLGVPSGVKVYSAVFAVNPRAAARIVEDYLRGRASIAEREVLDIDEDAYRAGRLKVRIYGYLLVPQSQGLVEGGKTHYSYSEDEDLEAIAEYIVEGMRDCTLYILGPGTTTMRIASKLGIDKTPLGVDAVHNRRLIGRDLDEKGLLDLVRTYNRTKIIVSPLGGQGFILGRGNQQISPAVLRLVGKDDLIVVATPRKLSEIKVLRVDTGDDEVDNKFRGYIRVVVGYGREKVMRVE